MITVNGQVYDGVMIKPDIDDLLEHHGVKGQKWGIRKAITRMGNRNAQRLAKRIKRQQKARTAIGLKPKTLKTKNYNHMEISNSDSAVTKRVKNDFNNMNDQEFMNKYKTSKKTYQKRVKKYGDPYKHRINSTSYKVLKKLSQ